MTYRANLYNERFVNTEKDLRICVYAMEDSDTIKELLSLEYEKDAMDKMYRLCNQFIKQYKRLNDRS